MWALILVTVTYGSSSSYIITSVDNFKTKESCVKAVEFSKKRQVIQDAYCVPKG